LNTSETSPTPAKYEDLAGLIEYALTRADLSEEEVSRGCDAAKQYRVASVVLRPSDVELAAHWLSGSSVQIAALVDFPEGHSTTSAKLYAARDLLRRGARQIDTMLNTGKLVSRQFQYLEMELLQMADACRESTASLAVHLQSEYLNEELKIVACRILRRAGVEYIGTDRIEDIPLLQAHAREKLKIKYRAVEASLESAQQWREAGCARIQLPNPTRLLIAWKEQLAAAPLPSPKPPVPSP